MTTYAVTHEVPESKRWYITPGKHYEVLSDGNGTFEIMADDGAKDAHRWDNNPHGVQWYAAAKSYHFWGIHDDEDV